MPNDTQVDHSLCSAAYCPMIGTSSRSTTSDSKQWLCFIHFAADERDAAVISGELTRLRWIVDIVRCLRAGQPLTDHMHQNFVLAQRSDLKQSDREDTRAWMIRLEGVLQQSCRDSLAQP
jgi:hypothetical protein